MCEWNEALTSEDSLKNRTDARSDACSERPFEYFGSLDPTRVSASIRSKSSSTHIFGALNRPF